MDISKEISNMTTVTKTFPLGTASVQNVAYALSEYLDTKKNLVTQTMRTRNGYSVQGKGDANMEWTRYLGMDAAVTIQLTKMEGDLIVEIGSGRWVEKLGVAAVGSIFFQPLLITSGIGAIRQLALPNDIFNFISDYLGTEPVEEKKAAAPKKICPNCGKEMDVESGFCSACGYKFPEEQPDAKAKPSVCPVCGKELNGDEAFCPLCGQKLNG